MSRFLAPPPSGAIPGKKRKVSISDEEKKRKKKEYESNRPDRQYSKKWEKDYPWLQFDGAMMTCKTCSEHFDNKNNNPFVNGTTNFRSSTVSDHAESQSHKKAVLVVKAKGQSSVQKLQSEAGRALKNIKSAELHRLTYLFRNAHAIAKQNRPLSDYKWLCEIDMAKGLEIGTTYINEHAVRSFIHSIAQVEKDATTAALGECNFFSFMMDGTLDISGEEQETIYVRYSKHGKVVDRFLNMSSPESTCALDLYNHTLEVFKGHGVDKGKSK